VDNEHEFDAPEGLPDLPGEDTEEEVEETFNRVKRHLKENKKAYLAAGGGVVVGVVGAGIFLHKGQIVDSFKLIHIQYKSPNITEVNLVKQACPDPIPILDKESGEVYRSIRRTAAATGRNVMDISKDAQGVQERFERLPDSVFA
jgi:hypothetical protein